MDFRGEVVQVSYKQHVVFGYAFPELNLEREYKEMDAWLIANPHKRPRRHVARFVHNWLRKSARQHQTVHKEADVGRGPQATKKLDPVYVSYLNEKHDKTFRGTFTEYKAVLAQPTSASK